MLQAIHSWGDYRVQLREFDAVLEHGRAVSLALSGQVAPAPHVGYGAHIFCKLLSHGVALRLLLGDPNRRSPDDFVDVSSLCALSRCALEAFEAFEYVAGHDVPDTERDFRLLLWTLHDQSRHLKMLATMAAADPRLAALRAEVERHRGELERHEFMATLPAELRAELLRRMARGEPPAFHLGLRQRCALSGIDADWYGAVMMQLSQYVHTLPYPMRHLARLEAGSVEALRLMAMPLVYALPLLVRAIQAMPRLMPVGLPQPPSRTARTMELWRGRVETLAATEA